MSEFKIHHHISELFTILGIGSDLAEKYVENVKKSIHPSSSTQLSTTNALQMISSVSSNPQAFLSKYEELKLKNVRDLDGFIILLEGLVQNEDLAKDLGSISAQILLADGVSGNIPYSNDIALPDSDRSHVALSSQDIDELKARLLKESQDSVARSGMLHKREGNESKPSFGPPIPEWLSNRPHLSLNFVLTDEAPLDGSIGPLGEVDIGAQEHHLLEDLLHLMMGCQGTYITTTNAKDPHDPPTFTVDSSVEPSLRELVNRILPLCQHYSQLISFVEDKSQYPQGAVNHALAAAIRNLIKDYMLLVTQLESQQRKNTLTLNRLWFYVEKTLTLLELLACVASSISKSKSYGGAVLTILHERTSLTGCKQLQDVMLYLTRAAAVPYMRMLGLWIYRGAVIDPYNEFMVVENEGSSESAETDLWFDNDLEDDFWVKKFSLSSRNIPTFLQAHSEIILKTGKYLNVIRESDPRVVCPDQDELVYSLRDKSYVDVIEKTYNFASKRLLQLLIKEKDLMARLRSVKHYFLLDQGDFVVQLLNLCESELMKNIDDVIPSRLESLLELALRTSSANSHAYKDDIHCTLLPYSLMSQMLRIMSIETDDEHEYRSLPERLHLTGLQGFSLTYNVEWPLSLIIGRKSHFCYQMIFRHLFYCKHVEMLLCRVWVSNKAARKLPVASSSTYTQAFTLRQRMLYFIQNLEYYMSFEVIERNWEIFLIKMQKVENIDEVLVCHSDFLDRCMKDCMLTSPELLRIVCKLSNICVNFSNFILCMRQYCSEADSDACCTDDIRDTGEDEAQAPSNPPKERPHEASESFEQTIARFDLQFTGMLVTLVDKISNRSPDSYDALIHVLYRLDFNNYYSKKSEGLQVCSSPENSLDGASGPLSG